NMFYRERKECNGCGILKYPLCMLSSGYAGKVRLRPWLKYNPLFWDLAYWNFMRRNRALAGVDEFIAISDFIKELLKRNGVPEGRIHRIPNVISIEDSGNEYPLDPDGPIVTYIGTLDRIKGVDLLIEAFNGIGKGSLLIVGDGPERKRLGGIAGSRVKFLGRMDYEHMPSIYRQSDVVVLPARWPEPLSRVLIEALCFGKPLVATDSGGNRDCIKDGKNGFLVKPGELGERLEKLISDPKLREKMGRESRKLYDERFESRKVIGEIVSLYTR
ncbi:MAG: glycosyltransferase family 4 protein, partial [Candidatus Altiarchaeota archaeon]|nr:glycosyltransferase family 4 protein [Candidatus Altiarchaeota archaeon]